MNKKQEFEAKFSKIIDSLMDDLREFFNAPNFIAAAANVFPLNLTRLETEGKAVATFMEKLFYAHLKDYLELERSGGLQAVEVQEITDRKKVEIYRELQNILQRCNLASKQILEGLAAYDKSLRNDEITHKLEILKTVTADDFFRKFVDGESLFK